MITTTRRMLAALLTVGALGVAAPGVAHAGESCHKIDATGTGQATGPTTTVATIENGGLLTGTTAGEFAFTPTSEPAVFLLEGTVTFTVNRATLAVDVAGPVEFTDPPSLALTFDVNSTPNGFSGTGKLAGADGNLRLAGVGAADGSFTETVTGEICVDLSPRS